jgi:hypothetical protein
MHDDPRDDIVWHAQTPSGWLHDLRNGVNTAGVSVVLGRRLLARGDHSGALDMLARAEESLAQCRELLAAGDDVLGLATAQGESRGAGAPPAASHP